MHAVHRIPEQITLREVGDEIIALDARSNRIHQLNPTASFIWRQCSQGASVEEAAAALVDAFGIDAAVAQRDVSVTVQALRTLNLL